MPRPIRSLITACRAIRQAVTIYAWMKNAFAWLVGIPSRLIASISAWWKGSSLPNAAPATGKTKRKGNVEPVPSVGPRFPRLKRLVSIFGSRPSTPAAPISPTPQKWWSGWWNSSEASADSPQCSSSSIGTASPARPSARGSSKRSAASSRRTSTKAGPASPSRSGAKTNSNKNSRRDSKKRC